jgi:hypothetical protein
MLQKETAGYSTERRNPGSATEKKPLDLLQKEDTLNLQSKETSRFASRPERNPVFANIPERIPWLRSNSYGSAKLLNLCEHLKKETLDLTESR